MYYFFFPVHVQNQILKEVMEINKDTWIISNVIFFSYNNYKNFRTEFK